MQNYLMTIFITCLSLINCLLPGRYCPEGLYRLHMHLVQFRFLPTKQLVGCLSPLEHGDQGHYSIRLYSLHGTTTRNRCHFNKLTKLKLFTYTNHKSIKQKTCQNTSEFFSYFPKCVWAYIISPNALDQASLKQLYGHFIPVFNFVLF